MIQAVLVFVFAFLGALLASIAYGFGYAFGAQFTAPRLAVLLVSGAALGGLAFMARCLRANIAGRITDRAMLHTLYGFGLLCATLGAALAVAL